MTRFALDSSAVITWVIQERHWQGVDAAIRRPGADPLLLGPTLTEVVRTCRRKGNASTPADLRNVLLAHGMTVELADEEDLMRAAALLELSDAHPGPPDPRTGQRGTLSLADATILAMAERLDVPVVTRDQHWGWFMKEGHTSARIATF